jgi:antirestriction protein ArdC
VPSANHRRLSDQERADRRRADRELTERAVAQLRSSDGWTRWLRARARTGLRRYSLRNQLLVCLQDPQATRVAGFRAWLSLGYCARKGETSRIRVWARCQPSQKRMRAWREAGADPADRPAPFFKLEAVFSQAQVAPLPPPATPAPLEPPTAPVEGDTLAWTLAPLSALADGLGVGVADGTLPAGCDGLYRPAARAIILSERLASANARVATLAHELAHALVRLDREDDDPRLGYAEEELVVESVATVVCAGLGLDTRGQSVPYLAGWSETADADTFERTAALVDRLARRIEASLEPATAQATPESGVGEGGAQRAA